MRRFPRLTGAKMRPVGRRSVPHILDEVRINKHGQWMKSDLPPNIVLYDGVCGLCSALVAWLVSHDHRGKLWFAPLQGKTAAMLRRRHPEIPETLETVVLVADSHIWLKSMALLVVARHLRWPWRLGWWLRWLPQSPLDAVYTFIANRRYQIWGRFETCRLPDVQEQQRFLP